MQYLIEFCTVIIIHIIAVSIPGPDFAMVSKNSLLYSKKAGIYTSLGIALSLIVHITYSLIGIGLIIAQSIILFSVIKYLGAAYIIYIGIKSLLAKKEQLVKSSETNKKQISNFTALRMGFLSNVLNPKVTLLFLSLFTQVINPETPLLIQLLYGVEIITMTFVWFYLVAIFFSQARIKAKFSGIQYYLEKGFGVILTALGIKIIFSDSK